MFRSGDRSVRRTAARFLAVAFIVAACSGSGTSTDGGPDAVGDGGAGAGGAIGAAGRGGEGGAAGEAGAGGTGGGGGGTCTANPAGNAQCTNATLSHLYLCSGSLVPARCTFLYAGDTVAAYCCP
jgi:hypothetical protein